MAPQSTPHLHIDHEDQVEIVPEWIEAISIEWARRFRAFPCRVNGKGVAVVEHPESDQALDDLALMLGFDPDIAIAPRDTLNQIIESAYFSHTREPVEEQNVQADTAEAVASGAVQDNDLLRTADSGPTVQRTNQILLDAVRDQSSDIHIEPMAQGLSVRFRMDGVLVEKRQLPRELKDSLTARIKVMAGLDVAEKRLPQDGTARVSIGRRELDVRISTLPVVDGERLVLRLLHRDQLAPSMDTLGMSDGIRSRLRTLLETSQGVIWVTGPTGSGKTTTLYSALSELDREQLNILTIEDPVEYRLEGLGQMSVKPSIGLTFASGLRHILRQDPDVILVGETRDLETAEIVVRASLTGHQVFSTLHTQDAVGVFGRLLDLGVPAYLLAASTRACLAQRLVRVLCPDCKQRTALSDTDRVEFPEAKQFKDPVHFTPKGCSSCTNGYSGRTAIFELIEMNEDLQAAIRPNCTVKELKAACASPRLTLWVDALKKVEEGITSFDEVKRVLGSAR